MPKKNKPVVEPVEEVTPVPAPGAGEPEPVVEVEEFVPMPIFDDEIDEPDEVDEPKPQLEKLVKVRANGAFHDGAFAKELAAHGYPVDWPNNEVRSVSAALYLKLMSRSGGRFAIVK